MIGEVINSNNFIASLSRTTSKDSYYNLIYKQQVENGKLDSIVFFASIDEIENLYFKLHSVFSNKHKTKKADFFGMYIKIFNIKLGDSYLLIALDNRTRTYGVPYLKFLLNSGGSFDSGRYLDIITLSEVQLKDLFGK